jgi:hypothetical protein
MRAKPNRLFAGQTCQFRLRCCTEARGRSKPQHSALSLTPLACQTDSHRPSRRRFRITSTSSEANSQRSNESLGLVARGASYPEFWFIMLTGRRRISGRLMLKIGLLAVRAARSGDFDGAAGRIARHHGRRLIVRDQGGKIMTARNRTVDIPQ